MDHDHYTPVDGIKDLCQTLFRLKKVDDIERFLKDLCTPQELNALSERWRICKLLEEKTLSYREIHGITGASLATIGRVARSLIHEPIQGYKIALKALGKNKKSE